MINFTKRYVNIVSFIISLAIMLFLNSQNIVNQTIETNEVLSKKSVQQLNLNQQNSSQQNQIKENPKEENKTNTEKASKENQKVSWQIEIPSINLKAQIAEGTSKEIMDKYVGHFEETVKTGGNVGLAAHNRGYDVNYFQDIKKLKEGDEIIYTYKEQVKKYIVKTQTIISDEDWTLLEKTEDNKLTLITCVENQPEYRRCIQAIEKKS